MSIPYIPGWWDQLAPSVLPLTQKISERIHPDEYAAKRLQDMVQQNPMLMEQFSNLDDNTRAMLAQSLGFKNVNPFTNLPVGQQRQEREQLAAWKQEAMQNPETAGELKAKALGTLTEPQRKIQDLQLSNLTTEGKKASMELKRLEDDLNQRTKVLGQKAPDALMAANAIFNGQPIDPAVSERMNYDAGFKEVVNSYVSASEKRLNARTQLAIAQARSPQEKSIALNSLNTAIDNATRELAVLAPKISSKEGLMSIDDNARRIFTQNQARYDELTTNIKKLSAAYVKAMQDMGVNVPEDALASTIVPPPSGSAAPSLSALAGQFNRFGGMAAPPAANTDFTPTAPPAPIPEPTSGPIDLTALLNPPAGGAGGLNPLLNRSDISATPNTGLRPVAPLAPFSGKKPNPLRSRVNPLRGKS